MEFKDRVFQARKAKGLSQEDLAEAVGVSRQAVSKWETGEAMPDMEKMIALCQALELDMEYLALGKEPAPAPPETKKPRKWIAAVLAAVLAAVCLGVGVLIGYFLPEMEEPSPLDTIEISQVTVTPVEVHTIGVTAFEIAIYPNRMPEGLAVAVLYGDINKPSTKICTRDEDCYRVTLSGSFKFRHRVTALLTLDGQEKQIRILDVYVDENGFGYEYIS